MQFSQEEETPTLKQVLPCLFKFEPVMLTFHCLYFAIDDENFIKSSNCDAMGLNLKVFLVIAVVIVTS